jgi:hypothetical protein
MELKVGESYNFFKNIKDWWIIKVIGDGDDHYRVKVLKRVGPDQKYREGELGFIGKRSNMFNTYQITKYHKADIDESFDPEIDELIAHVQKKFTQDQLIKAIDDALSEGNKVLFMELTNKLKGVLV